MPRFVLLRHQCLPNYVKPSHWDLMLEQGESLATWELRELPASWSRWLDIEQAATRETVSAIRLPDHRLAYLDYEGPLSEDRGEVQQADVGSYELLSQQEDSLDLSLRGTKIRGRAQLSLIAGGWQLKTQQEPQC